MLLRCMIAVVLLTLVSSGTQAVAEAEVTPNTPSAATPRAEAATNHVTRRYGGPPVRVEKGDRLVMKFHGRAGDRVRLTVPVDKGEGWLISHHPTEKELTSLRTPEGRRVAIDSSSFYRLPTTGWFRFHYRSVEGLRSRVQLMKQIRLHHDGTKMTHVPQRRGYQYAVRLRVGPGIRVVSFGTQVESAITARPLESAVSAFGRVGYGTESIVIGPGLAMVGHHSGLALTEPLKKGQRILALLSSDARGRVITTRPERISAVVDGPAVPFGRDGAVMTTIDSADVATSAERLLHARVVGSRDWNLLVVAPDRTVHQLAAPGRYADAPLLDLHELEVDGTYRVVVYPLTTRAGRGSLELDTVADGGAVTVDGPGVTVPARADGRFTLLSMDGAPQTTRYLSVSDATLAPPWRVHAGLLEPDCGDHAPGCGDGERATSTDQRLATGDGFSYGGSVLVMPLCGQTSGTLTVRISTGP